MKSGSDQQLSGALSIYNEIDLSLMFFLHNGIVWKSECVHQVLYMAHLPGGFISGLVAGALVAFTGGLEPHLNGRVASHFHITGLNPNPPAHLEHIHDSGSKPSLKAVYTQDLYLWPISLCSGGSAS